MRVSDSLRYGGVQRQLAQLGSRYADASQRATTGSRLTAPSDDPIAAAALARNRSSQRASEAYRAAIRDARGDAELAESTLDFAGQALQRLQEIAVQGGSEQLAASDRAALAVEVRSIKAHLVDLANAKGQRGYVFAGSRVDAPPFDATGAFSGDDFDQVIDLGHGDAAVISTSGARAFTAVGGRDVLADVENLALALEGNDAAGVRSRLPDLESSRQQLMRAQGEAGLVLSRLEVTATAQETFGTLLARDESQLGAIDPGAAYTELTQLSSAIESSLAVARKVLELSTLNRF